MKKLEKIEFDKNYLNTIRKSTVKNGIIGRDPYPKGAIGIPFCKKLWPDIDDRSAGLFILNTFYKIDKNIDPVFLFHEMAHNGTIVINASYYILGEPYKASVHKKCVDEAWDTINKDLILSLNSEGNIYLCGDAGKMLKHIFDDKEIKQSIKATVKYVSHPCLQSRNRNKSRWDETWKAIK